MPQSFYPAVSKLIDMHVRMTNGIRRKRGQGPRACACLQDHIIGLEIGHPGSGIGIVKRRTELLELVLLGGAHGMGSATFELVTQAQDIFERRDTILLGVCPTGGAMLCSLQGIVKVFWCKRPTTTCTTINVIGYSLKLYNIPRSLILLDTLIELIN
jgi:hypothetical protein